MTAHLIHIGYAKTGTNFLRRWFEAHPELAYAERGIAGFHDVHGIVRAGASQQPLPRYWVTSSEALSTPHDDAGLGAYVDYGALRRSSIYDAQSHACRTLAELFPQAHILIVTRGFRSMIMSGYSQYVRTGGSESLADLCKRRSPADDGGVLQWHYDFLVAEYRRTFGQDHVTVLPYELLQEDLTRFMGLIAGRLGIMNIEPPAGRPNPSLSPIELAWYPELTRRLSASPAEEGLQRGAMEDHLRAINENRLRETIEQLQRMEPREPVTAALLTDEVLEPFRAFAQGFRDDPLYRPYARDYLFDTGPGDRPPG